MPREKFVNSATGVVWDLTDLYESPQDSAIDRDLKTARDRALDFEKTYRGKIKSRKTIQPQRLLKALEELEEIHVQMSRSLHYASLLHAGQSQDPQHGALLSIFSGTNDRDQTASAFFRPRMDVASPRDRAALDELAQTKRVSALS